MIEVSNVVKTYGKGANAYTALNGVTFTVPDGALVAIVGKSGSGKSTLMHVMSGLDHATTGKVIVNGKNLKDMKRKELDAFRSTEMSFIFQSFFVQGNDNCFDNVALPLEISQISRRKRTTRVREALAGVELSDKEKSKAKNLSGGQKQRLAIARAVAGKPRILFADEPTGNLDSVTGQVIEKLLFDYAKANGATLIIVTHDTELASRCHIQIHIKDGEIERIEDTTNQEATR